MQGVLGILRAFEWFRIGVKLSGHSVFMLPVLGAVVFAGGGWWSSSPSRIFCARWSTPRPGVDGASGVQTLLTVFAAEFRSFGDDLSKVLWDICRCGHCPDPRCACSLPLRSRA